MEAIQLDPFSILVLTGIIIVIIWIILVGQHWLKATVSGIQVTPTQIILMRLRGTPIKLFISLLIKANKSGVLIKRDELEACYLAGGNITNIVDGLIYAKSKNIDFNIKKAMQLDMEKRDLVAYLKNK